MSYYLGYNTALEFYRANRPWTVCENARRRYPKDAESAPYGIDPAQLACFGIRTPPFHVLVPRSGMRRRNEGIAYHALETNIPKGAFVRIGPSLYASSPKYLFAQMASRLSTAELICLGFELCGRYLLSPNDIQGFVPRDPLVTAGELKRYTERAGAPNRRKAARSARYVLDNAASPMETALAALLSLPPLLGGMGFPRPELNRRIDVPACLRRATRKRYYVCDLYWPSARLAVEYDSDMFHTGGERIARDAERRNDLAHIGIEVVTVTKGALFDERLFEKTSIQIGRRLGVDARRIASRCNTLAQRDLRKILLASPERQSASYDEREFACGISPGVRES